MESRSFFWNLIIKSPRSSKFLLETKNYVSRQNDHLPRSGGGVAHDRGMRHVGLTGSEEPEDTWANSL